MRRLAVTLAALSAAALSAVTKAQDGGGCTDFMTMQANYMALVILRSIAFGSRLPSGCSGTRLHPSLTRPRAAGRR